MSYTVKQLRELAKKYQIPGRSKLKSKADLEKALKSYIAREPLTLHEEAEPRTKERANNKPRTLTLARRLINEGPRILQEMGTKEGVEKGRRTITFKYFDQLENDLSNRMMKNLKQHLQTSYYLRYSYTYRLKNVENQDVILWHKTLPGSPWLNTINQAGDWLKRQEAIRLNVDNIERPNTKWVFVRHICVNLKIVIDKQPLVGDGVLPDWLRYKQSIIALDSYVDNLCLWRCIAVGQGARIDRCSAIAKKLAKEFYGAADLPKTSLNDLDKIEEHLKLGIQVYEATEDAWHLMRRPANYKVKITIGVYEEHAFYIKDINKLAGVKCCGACRARFTQTGNLQRHAKTCLGGKQSVICKNEQIKKPASAFEKAFYPNYGQNSSKMATRWIEYEAQKRGIHIHHDLCGHGGERYINNSGVDGYHHESKTVFQFHGCCWHGCPKHSTQVDAKAVYDKTLEMEQRIRDAGYNLVVMWECRAPKICRDIEIPKVETQQYPHFIVYDFEAYLDKTKTHNPTENLSVENNHTPISVSIGDTLHSTPTHIVSKDQQDLIAKFVSEIERRAQSLRVEVRAKYIPKDFEMLPKKVRRAIDEWTDQVPVVGFNSGKYDLNLIKQHFVGELADTCKTVQVGKKAHQTMFLITTKLRFLDVINYLGPGTSYDKWVKAYGCKHTKSWFPYEWFDSPEKLAYKGLPDYLDWYSKLKNKYLLKLSDWKNCKRIFREKGMQTFGDWLERYNNLDVEPFLEALNKMKSFYSDRGIDILKDAVSLPGVSLQYLMRGTLSAKNPPELYSPSKEAYEMLKASVVGGPSIVFTRLHEAGKTKIRSHQYTKPKPCKKVLGYDANCLYLSTMAAEMPCGKETIHHCKDPIKEAAVLKKQLQDNEWFGFAEVDIEVPKNLWPKFEEMCPLFYNKEVPEEVVPSEMLDYLKSTGRSRTGNQKKLVGALSAQKILLYAPLLKWYIEEGLIITACYRTITYKPQKIFEWFVEQVTEARRTGDSNKSKAILAEVFKLLGNSAYGKLIEAIERHKNTVYTKDEKCVDRALRSAWFEDLNEIGEAYELESRKPRVTIKRAFQVGIAVYQLAKLRMLEFYHNFLDKYVDREDFELIQMDTDSLYLGLSSESLEQVVKPHLKNEYQNDKNNWLSWNQYSNRTPGLFKLEFQGERAIALCSKCYYVDAGSGGKSKYSSKGMSQRHNDLTWGRYSSALNGHKDMAENRGFRMRDGVMTAYHQIKLGLSSYYDKRRVLSDGVHTEPIEYA